MIVDSANAAVRLVDLNGRALLLELHDREELL